MASKKVTIDYDEAVNFLAGMFPSLSVHIIERALDENDGIMEPAYESLLRKTNPELNKKQNAQTGMNVLQKNKKEESPNKKAGPTPALTKEQQEAEQKAWEEAWKIQEQYYQDAEKEEYEYQANRNAPLVDEFKFGKDVKPKPKKVVIGGMFEKQADPLLEELQFSKSFDEYVKDAKEKFRNLFKSKKGKDVNDVQALKKKK